ncbi:MAG: DsbA family protein [Acidobacteria bacterium]|nr:DsbA family protein [Acidobacteriota bacterium]
MKSALLHRLSLLTLGSVLLFCVSDVDAQIPSFTKSESTEAPVSKEQKASIESVIREYLLKNPSIIREAMQALQAQEEDQRRLRVANNLKELRSAIYSDPDSPIAGNAKADVTIIVFFDYNCGYCKTTLRALDALVLKDPALRVVYKEFPVLGPQSYLAAKAALAAARQGKYVQFHQALMESQNSDEVAVKSISDQLGLNHATLQKDMADPKLNEQLDRNIRLAGSLDINGTPAYIIGETIIPGAVDSESLARFVTIERSKLKEAIPAKSVIGLKK